MVGLMFLIVQLLDLILDVLLLSDFSALLRRLLHLRRHLGEWRLLAILGGKLVLALVDVLERR